MIYLLILGSLAGDAEERQEKTISSPYDTTVNNDDISRNSQEDRERNSRALNRDKRVCTPWGSILIPRRQSYVGSGVKAGTATTTSAAVGTMPPEKVHLAGQNKSDSNAEPNKTLVQFLLDVFKPQGQSQDTPVSRPKASTPEPPLNTGNRRGEENSPRNIRVSEEASGSVQCQKSAPSGDKSPASHSPGRSVSVTASPESGDSDCIKRLRATRPFKDMMARHHANRRQAMTRQLEAAAGKAGKCFKLYSTFNYTFIFPSWSVCLIMEDSDA